MWTSKARPNFDIAEAPTTPSCTWRAARYICAAAAARDLDNDDSNTMSTAISNLQSADRVRLHITPFNPQLVDRILAPSVKPLASNISFHTEQTFPERGFGYVELPVMEAKKLKAKLNGSTLKGAKVRIEDAKPERKRKVEVEDQGEEVRKARKKLKKEKRKREEGVLPGHELEEGRRVKRGWTGDESKEHAKGKKKKEKEQEMVKDAVESGDKRRLRFKTTVPPNATPLLEKIKAKPKKEGKARRKKKKTVVEEFANTKKSREINIGDRSATHGAVAYEDGKGWVDESGAVVEAERPSKKPRRRRQQEEQQVEDSQMAEADDQAEERAEPVTELDATSTATAEPVAEETEAAHDTPVETEAEKEVHPLEALFKRPVTSPTDSTKPKPKPIDTSFSFFDATAAEEDDTVGTDMPPQTPHTRRDLEWRSIRSAAPTPDTAAIGRKFSFPFAPEADDEEEEMDGAPDAEMEDAEEGARDEAQTNGQGREGESAFRKWFYDNRGDFNRGWKRRRREEKKQKRQTMEQI